MNWFKCSKEAHEKCPDGHVCGDLGHAIFLEGSPCHKFNQQVEMEGTKEQKRMTMREILFRGKRIDNGEWVYGSFCMDALEQKNGLCGMDGFIRLYDADTGKMQMHEVDRETVGQYTGLTDKNGKKIFEGDIVRNGDYTMIVVWCGFHAAFMLAFRVDGDYFEAISNSHIYLEVIGNIHDNPELLNGGEKNE